MYVCVCSQLQKHSRMTRIYEKALKEYIQNNERQSEIFTTTQYKYIFKSICIFEDPQRGDV